MESSSPTNKNYNVLDTNEDDFIEANNYSNNNQIEDDSSSEEESSTLWELLPSKLSIKNAEQLASHLPFQLAAWCSRMEACLDAQDMQQTCKDEVVRLNSLIETIKAGSITGKEVDFFHVLLQLHFIQLVAPSAGSNKLEWLHPALALCNWHNLVDASRLGKFGPKSFLNRAKLYQINKVPVMILYSILSVSLTTSFKHLPLTIDSLTLMFNILQKDLRSNNEHIVIEALKALVWLPECDLVSDNLTLVLSILAPDTELNHFVANKVLQVVHRVLKHRSESGSGLGIPHSQLVQLILFGLKQKALYSTSLCLAKVAVLSPNFPVRAIIFSVTGVLSKLISDDSCHSPWVQTKCLEIMFLVSPSNQSLSRIFFPLVIDCLHNASKFPGLAIIVACARAIGSMTLGSVDGVDKSFEFINDLMRLLFVRDLLSRKAALRMLVFLLPHRSFLNVEEYESFLFSEVKEKSIEAVKLGVSMKIDQRLSEEIAAAGSIPYSVEALKAMIKMSGYSDQTISYLLRIFRYHFPLPNEKTCSVIQKLEYCLKKCSTDHYAAPFRILLLTATHHIFSNPSSYITYALSKHHRILIYALSIINLESNITIEILAVESLWVFLHHFEYAFQNNTSQLRQHLDLFKSPLKYVIIKKLEGLGTRS